MTQEDIIEMARQAGCPDVYTEWAKSDWASIKGLIVPMTLEQLVHCAKLVAAKAITELERQETNTVTLTQTNIGIGERGMQAYEEAKKRGWVGLADEQ
jgi:hypothetical protein